MEVTIGVLGFLLFGSWAYILLLVFSFEHQNVAEVHDKVIEAYREVRLGNTHHALMLLAGLTGTIEGTWGGYPWVRFKKNFHTANTETIP